METVVTKTDVYSFSELSEEAKEHTLEKQYDINVDGYDWWDGDFDDFKAIGKILGIDIDNVYFSGFSSQGDGACFEGNYEYKKGMRKAIKEYAPKDTELHEIAERLFNIQRKSFYALSATIKHSGHYYHEMCTVIDVWNDMQETYASSCSDDEIHDVLRSFMQWIYSQLNKQYDFLTSEEVIIETLECNGYQFTIDGKLL